ncbi:hypothetical protein BGY98DRAFT_948201, partial [Russula aff. rugulosa BPL654]
TTFKMAFSLTIVFISVTLTHEKSLSSKRQILSSTPPTSQRGASAMSTRARLSVTQPIHDIPYNGSLPHRGMFWINFQTTTMRNS